MFMPRFLNYVLSAKGVAQRTARLVEHLGLREGMRAAFDEIKAAVATPNGNTRSLRPTFMRFGTAPNSDASLVRPAPDAPAPAIPAPDIPAPDTPANDALTDVAAAGAPADASQPAPTPAHAAYVHTLTAALIDVAAHHGVAADPVGLCLALPRTGADLDARAAPIALARLGLEARWTMTTLAAIEDSHCPAVLELTEGGFLVVERRASAVALEVRCGQARATLPLATLAQLVTGRLLVLGLADPINGAKDADDRAAIAKGPRRWILMRFLEDKRLIGQLVLASILLNLCSLAMPLFQRAVYDRVIPNLALESLWALSIGIVIALAFEFALRGARHDFIESQGLRVAQHVQTRVMSTVLSARMEKAPRNPGAALVALRDIEGLALLAPAAIATFLVDLPFFLVFLAAITFMAGPIALCVVAGAIALVVIGVMSLKGAGPASARNIQLSRARNTLIVDAVDGLSTIKANQAEGKFTRNWSTVCDHLAMTGHEIRRSTDASASASGFVIQAVTIASIVVGVLLVKAGDLSAGALIGATLLAGRAMTPISSAIGIINRAYLSLGQFKAMADLLSLPSDRHDPRASILHTPRLGSYDCRALTVTYEGSHDAALRGVTLRIRAGEKIAVIGRSGSGKSTLLQVLAGLVAPSDGAVLIDGHNLQHLQIDGVRAGLAYAAQDATLFDASLRDNLTLGLDTIDFAKVERAVQRAGIEAIARALPDGYATLLGPRGSRLSGGQRQAIILARAFARSTPVLILDEPTSAMDTQTEQSAIAGIRAAAADATLILATHRVELLAVVDRVIWLDQGRIVADRPRDEILAMLRAKTGDVSRPKGFNPV